FQSVIASGSPPVSFIQIFRPSFSASLRGISTRARGGDDGAAPAARTECEGRRQATTTKTMNSRHFEPIVTVPTLDHLAMAERYPASNAISVICFTPGEAVDERHSGRESPLRIICDRVSSARVRCCSESGRLHNDGNGP